MTSNSFSKPDPPTALQSAPVFGLGIFHRPIGEASLAGLMLGLADILNVGDLNWLLPAYFLVGVMLGLRHVGRAWPCWPLLGTSLYLVHIAAITCGRGPPSVEPDYHAARATLMCVFPAGLGLAIGACIRRAVVALGWFHREGGPPVRLLPRTTRGVLITVAGIGVAIGSMRWIAFDSGTLYSAGYDEGRFYQVNVGMTYEQVEALVGPPIVRVAWSDDGTQNLKYTEQAAPTSNYWRRWVFIKDGKVQNVVSDYWWD